MFIHFAQSLALEHGVCEAPDEAVEASFSVSVSGQSLIVGGFERVEAVFVVVAAVYLCFRIH